MRKFNETISRPTDLTRYKRKAYRQDPLVSALLETIPIDSPQLKPALNELAALRAYGIELTADLVMKVATKFANRQQPERPKTDPVAAMEAAKPGEVVYYARIGNRVKIGTSANLESRMKTVNPEELMAAEPGGHALEHCRHLQFEHLRTHGEWFRYEAELASHIAILKQARVIPWPRSSTPPH